MDSFLNILIKGLIVLKSILAILFSISVFAITSELWSTRNQIEGRELIEGSPEEIIIFLVMLFALITTLLFDIRTLKRKETLIYKNWAVLLLLTIIVIAISTIFKIQWLGICLMLLIGFYAVYLLFKFKKA
ncbi:MAG: hypothetical protein CVU08_08995 [Bacteroidetes bacterium HGW-Bacteroidetes-3]|jgi:Ca2+/Na+ antiporter|nr:MAG: hypothetical protein CVU08_08995 [Bacteroidetes bacterium HGW-Bacteroidetes-3]